MAGRMKRQKAKETTRPIGGGKLARTETVTVRLDPRLRYLAELAARKQRRTLSSFIEWSIEDALKRVSLGGLPGRRAGASIDDEANALWDIDEADRFIRLGFGYPELLTYDEQRIWKLLNDSFLLSPAYHPEHGLNWDVLEQRVLPVIGEYWRDVRMVALGPPSERRLWVERTRAKVASGKVFPPGDNAEKKRASKETSGDGG
jgi:hypothetical protein